MRCINSILDIKLSTAVAAELVTLTEVKDHLKIDTSDDDTRLGALITECRKRIENYTGRAIGEQERIVIADLYEEFEVPYSPVTELEAEFKSDISTYDAMTADDDYELEGADVSRFRPFTSGRWKLTYTCGYDEDTLPEDLRLAILNEIAYRWENRGDQGNICDAARVLALPYKRTLI